MLPGLFISGESIIFNAPGFFDDEGNITYDELPNMQE